MAEPLHVSEGKIVDAAGNLIAELSDVADAERFTALENRIAALENAHTEHLESEHAPEVVEDPDAPSPPGGPLKIHVGPEDTPTGEPVPTPIGVSSPGSPPDVDGIPDDTPADTEEPS